MKFTHITKKTAAQVLEDIRATRRPQLVAFGGNYRLIAYPNKYKHGIALHLHVGPVARYGINGTVNVRNFSLPGAVEAAVEYIAKWNPQPHLYNKPGLPSTPPVALSEEGLDSVGRLTGVSIITGQPVELRDVKG